ncbi:conserved protein of unknown function [Nitrospira japonica]|uniref:Endonuclease GajA/Old nuclease/RecF-like AAA domain-containing protein n=1 Tax=Nitrospira japonica TaxID=1325564 RepID=A0A1W1I4Z0_9BACT|nr:conserved protein of unknown function [Nitrospira japonica]
MRIKNIAIKNFRSIKDANLLFPENNLLILVGANNAGKSNIVRTVNNILGPEWWTHEKLQARDHYGHDTDNQISIKLSFDTQDIISFKWHYQQSQYKLFGNGSFLTNELKGQFPCTYLGADRTFDRQCHSTIGHCWEE